LREGTISCEKGGLHWRFRKKALSIGSRNCLQQQARRGKERTLANLVREEIGNDATSNRYDHAKIRRGQPVFPDIPGGTSDALLSRIHECGEKWIVLVDTNNEPKMVLNSDEFIRDALFNHERFNPYRHCHRPVIVTNGQATIGDVIVRLKVNPEHCLDDVVDHDVILFWNETRQIITGGDILGRLLRGIVQNPVLKQGVA